MTTFVRFICGVWVGLTVTSIGALFNRNEWHHKLELFRCLFFLTVYYMIPKSIMNPTQALILQTMSVIFTLSTAKWIFKSLNNESKEIISEQDEVVDNKVKVN